MFRLREILKSKASRRRTIIRLLRLMELGLKSGLDQASALKWAQKSLESEHSEFLRRLLRDIEWRGAGEAFQQTHLAQDFSEKLFLKVLGLSLRSQSSSATLFREMRDMLQEADFLQMKSDGLSLMPKIQGLFVALSSLGITALIANQVMAGGLRQLGHEFYICVALIIGGLFWMSWIWRSPAQLKRKIEGPLLFFRILSFHISQGLDFSSAWAESMSFCQWPRNLEKKLKRAPVGTDTMEEFLAKLSRELRSWSAWLDCIRLARESSMGFANFLKDLSESESRYYFTLWENKLRRAQALSLIPLGILIMPSALFCTYSSMMKAMGL